MDSDDDDGDTDSKMQQTEQQTYDIMAFVLSCVPRAVSMVRYDAEYDRIFILRELLTESEGTQTSAR